MTHILIIDDDPTIQNFLKRALSNQGYVTSIATDGQEGLELAIAHAPALIICDWLMPGINGLEVCRKIKDNPQFASTLFILLTSLAGVEDKIRGLDAGADDFLSKPIEICELQAKVRAALRIHQLTADLQYQKHQLESELNEAAHYVQSLLPLPLRHPQLQINTCFIPSLQLGGDGFDYFWLDKTHIAFYLLDVSGHGLRAALPSISVINLLRSRTANQPIDYFSPCQVLSYLNCSYQLMDEHQQYLTIWYGVYDTVARELTYASAGHPPAILATDDTEGELQHLKTKGIPIGILSPEEANYSETSLSIPHPATLYLFSDGVYENREVDDHQQQWHTFLAILKQREQQPAAVRSSHATQSLESLVTELRDRLHGDQVDDDFSLMEIQF